MTDSTTVSCGSGEDRSHENAPAVTPGQALVLYGPQGCGKTLLARKLAAARGPFCEVDAERLQSFFQSWLRSETRTVVVDGLPEAGMALERVRGWVSVGHMGVHRPMRGLRIRRTPNFIFCTGDASALRLVEADRRFVVRRLGPPR